MPEDVQAATFVAGARLALILDSQPDWPHSDHTWNRSMQQHLPVVDAILYLRMSHIVPPKFTDDLPIYICKCSPMGSSDSSYGAQKMLMKVILWSGSYTMILCLSTVMYPLVSKLVLWWRCSNVRRWYLFSLCKHLTGMFRFWRYSIICLGYKSGESIVWGCTVHGWEVLAHGPAAFCLVAWA